MTSKGQRKSRRNEDLRSVANDYVYFTLEDDVVEGVFTKPTFWDYNVAREIVHLRLLMCGSKSYPLYLDVREVNGIDLKARQYMASPLAMEKLTAGALRINSSLGRMAANFFLAVNKPKLPLKVFTSKEEALKWLGQYKAHVKIE